MSFRFIAPRTVLRVCTSTIRVAPKIQNITHINGVYLRSVNQQGLNYMQCRGIFWNDKKGGEEKAAETEQKGEEQKGNNTDNATAQEATKEQETKTKQEETTTTKTETASKTQKKETTISDQFDSVLDGLSGETKRKLQTLWSKLERELEEKQKQLAKAKSTADVLEKATAEGKQKIDNLRESLKEEIGEKELMRKRFDKELAQSKVYAIQKFAQDLIEVPDNLGRALDAAKALEGKGDNLYEGVKGTNKILLKVLEKHGIIQINPMAEKFDPNYHEALFDFEDPNQRPGTCGYVANVGYVINDRVLRPAKVGVVKGVYVEEKAAEAKKE